MVASMTTRDFMYWLQGYFELTGYHAGGIPPFTKGNAECVRRHIKLVQSIRGGEEFILGRIAGLLDIIEADVQGSSKPVTERIAALVAEHFQHVIDPKDGDAETQAKLNEIHGPIGGRLPGRPDAIYRC